MTDYFSHFCFVVPFNAEQTAWAKRLLAAVDALYDSVAEGTDHDAQYDDIWEAQLYVAGGDAEDPVSAGFEIKVEDGLVVITDYAGQPGLDTVPRLIESVMKHFDMDGKIGFEWGETASRSVPGAFGGGAFLVSKEGITHMSASRWLEDGLQTPRIKAINEVLASWDFGAGSNITDANLIEKRLAENLDEEFSREMRLKTSDGAVIDAQFDLHFLKGTSIVSQARIHANDADYGHSPILAPPAAAAVDDSPQP